MGWLVDAGARSGRPRDFAALFAIGDRGAGKTYAAVGILGTLQIEFPIRPRPFNRLDRLPSAPRSFRVDRTFKTIFPSQWYRYRGGRIIATSG